MQQIGLDKPLPAIQSSGVLILNPFTDIALDIGDISSLESQRGEVLLVVYHTIICLTLEVLKKGMVFMRAVNMACPSRVVSLLQKQNQFGLFSIISFIICPFVTISALFTILDSIQPTISMIVTKGTVRTRRVAIEPYQDAIEEEKKRGLLGSIALG
jgi:hypothetical protein